MRSSRTRSRRKRKRTRRVSRLWPRVLLGTSGDAAGSGRAASRAAGAGGPESHGPGHGRGDGARRVGGGSGGCPDRLVFRWGAGHRAGREGDPGRGAGAAAGAAPGVGAAAVIGACRVPGPELTLFVGGGIKSPDQGRAARGAGADFVVVGTALEERGADLPAMVRAVTG